MQVNTKPYKNPKTPDYSEIRTQTEAAFAINKLPKIFSTGNSQTYQAGDYIIELTRVNSKPDKYVANIYLALPGLPFEKIGDISDSIKGRNQTLEAAYEKIISHQQTSSTPGKTGSIEFAKACLSHLTFDNMKDVHGIGIVYDPNRSANPFIDIQVLNKKTTLDIKKLINPNGTFRGCPVIISISPMAKAQFAGGYFSGATQQAKTRRTAGIVLGLGLVVTLICVLK